MGLQYFLKLSCFDMIKVILQGLAAESFCFALSWNMTTGWHTVCQFVHRAGDWRGGSPSQIAGCCPKTAAHCHYCSRTENQGQQRTMKYICLLTATHPQTSAEIQRTSVTQRNYADFFVWWYATVKVLKHYLCRGVFLQSLGQLCASIVHLCWGNPNIRLDVIERNEAMLQAVKPFALKHTLKCSLLISDQVGYYLSWRA